MDSIPKVMPTTTDYDDCKMINQDPSFLPTTCCSWFGKQSHHPDRENLGPGALREVTGGKQRKLSFARSCRC